MKAAACVAAVVAALTVTDAAVGLDRLMRSGAFEIPFTEGYCVRDAESLIAYSRYVRTDWPFPSLAFRSARPR